ncbi:hypothetical protein [uncultured Holdemanella sp.]|uniref:hypothetical protein n=1 Tax=uncultured Holdemanella sp. TaxID=1763549 RepID=UPI0025D3FCF7|nr:hypothetical protein [uncultured Holdemanella sp.]
MIIYLYFLTIYHKTKHFTVIIIIKDIIFPVASILFKTIERHKLHKTTIQLF